jgi:hypothetical protein
MNTKGMKFLAVLAVLAMAFAAFAVFASDDISTSDAEYSKDVKVGDITFHFGEATIVYGDYGTVTVSDVQSLTGEATKNTIKLKGDLVKLGTESATSEDTVDTIEAMYGGKLPSDYGVAFTITGLSAGDKVKLNAGETTVTGTSDELYQPFSNVRTAASATEFNVIITFKSTGLTTVYTIDISELVKAQVDSNKYFGIQDAIDAAAAGKTITILADSAQNIDIAKAISFAGTGKEVLSGNVFVQFAYGDIEKDLGIAGFSEGKLEFKNLKFVVSGRPLINTGLEAYVSTTTVAKTFVTFDGCSIENTVNGVTAVMVWKAPLTLTVKNSNFSVKAGTIPGYAICDISNAASGTLAVTGTTFTGAYTYIANTDEVNKVTLTGNTVSGLAEESHVVKICANQVSAGVMSGIEVNITDNILPKGVIDLEFAGSFTNATVESVKVQGLTVVGGVVKVPAAKTMAVSVLRNTGTITVEGTVTVNHGINNTGTITNTGTINFDGKYANTGTFNNQTGEAPDVKKGTIVCAESYQVMMLKNDEHKPVGGVIKFAGSSIEPAEVDVDDSGKVPSSDAPVVDVTGKVKEAVAKENQAINISQVANEAVLDASKSNAVISLVGVAMGETDVATIKTATSTIQVKGFSGNVTFTSGSIIVIGEPWSGGTIFLKDGDVLKLSGTITANSYIKMDAEAGTNAKATVLIESGEGKGLTIADGVTLDVASKIAVQVDGTIHETLGILKTAGTLTINGKVGSKINASNTVDIIGEATGDVTTTKTINVYGTASGAYTLSGESAKLIAYQESDINDVTLPETADRTKVSGKDESGGTWSFDGVDTLTITGYNGAYNFGVKDTKVDPDKTFAELITKIVLSGNGIIGYELPETSEAFNLFPAVTEIKTVQGTGSLLIQLDVSKADKTAIEAGVKAIGNNTNLKLSSVDLGVYISGTNATWDAKKIKAYGIDALELKMDSASIAAEVFPNVTADKGKVFGIDATSIEMNKSNVLVASGGIGIDLVGKLTLANASGIAATGSALGMKVSNGADISGASGLIVGNGLTMLGGVELTQSSTITAEKFSYGDKATEMVLKNYGEIAISGASVIYNRAIVENYDSFSNAGTMNVFGKIDNKTGGDFTNTGTMTVFAKKMIENTEKTITFTAGDTITTKTAQITSITINESEFMDNGVLKIKKATVTFAYKGGEEIVPKDADAYTGTLTPVQGVAADKKDYTLTISNGTSSITVTYDSSKDAELGKGYVVEPSGTVVDVTDATKKYSVVKAGAVAVEDTIDDLITSFGNSSSLLVSAGEFTNEGSVVSYGTENQTIVGENAEFNGVLIVGVQKATIAGKFNGNLVSKGDVVVSGTFDGNIDTAGGVEVTKKFIGGNILATGAVTGETGTATIDGNITAGGIDFAGTIVGEIFSKGDVTVTNVLGDITVDKKAGAEVTIKGAVIGELTYNSKAKAKVPAEGEVVEDTVYPIVMFISADLDKSTAAALVIKLNKATDATSTAAAIPGFFSIDAAGVSALSDGKSVAIDVTKGKLLFSESVVMPERYAFIFEADTIAEVSTVATIDFSDSALKVSKDATSNFVTGTTPITDYGLVKAIMSFTIGSGAYTIYSGVTYALSECEENSELIVELDATLTDNVSVKKGVNVIVSNGVTLDFDKYGIFMDEGATITLEGTGKVIFKATGQNLYPGDDTKDYEFYTVDGTIVYGDNAVEFEGVRFTDESTIVGVAATSTEVAKIGTTLLYNQGTATISEGVGTGSITLANVEYTVDKAGDKADFYATFVIGPETIFDAVSIKDAFAVVDYKFKDDKFTVDEFKLEPTIVAVEGVLNLFNDTELKGVYSGLGTVTLAAGKEFKFAEAQVPVEADLTNKTYPGSALIAIVDTTDDMNGYYLNLVKTKYGKTLTLMATTQKIGTETYNVMTISGTVDLGIITGEDAVLKQLTVNEDASVVADNVFVVGAGASKADGYVGAKVIYMKDTDKTYQDLLYKVTFEKEGYTFYTQIATIDWDEVTDITIAKDLAIEDDLDVSGKDVNIIVADEVTLTINEGKKLIIGTPADDIGLISVLSGNVKLLEGAYIIAYADVDFEDAVFIDAAGTKKVKSSIFTIEDVLYATAFANSTAIAGGAVTFDTVADDLVPEIEGYIFTTWYLLNGKPLDEAFIGETSAYAGSKAVLVTVIVKFVDGVSYYCDGVEFAIYDTPTKVEYNSVFTAKINNTAKYEGTPLINGKNSFIVTDDVTLNVTGVNPIPVPPEPEPEPVIGDSGISLTDILLIVLVVLIAIMVVILVLRLNRS